MSTTEQRMRNLFEALADSVESMSDEEILDECCADGEDPALLAEHTRDVLRGAFEQWKARREPTDGGDA